MKSLLPQLANDPNHEVLRPVDPPSRETQQLWFMLSRRRWTSLALIPADEGGSTAALAASLAEVGRQLREGAVTALQLPRLDYITASGIADAIAAAGRGEGVPDGVPQNLQVIVAVPSVLSQPLAVAVAHAADAAVLCVELGRTRLSSARRTIELVGRDLFVGSIIIRP